MDKFDAKHSCCGSKHGPSETPKEQAVDPVCGMTVDPVTAKYKTSHEGKDYFFCSGHCLHKFREAPKGKGTGLQACPPKLSSSTEYTCPMHPEVVRSAPGDCPICGMALEPKEPAMEEDTTELDDMARRFKGALALSLPLLVLSMAEMLPGLDELAHASWNRLLQLALATPVVLWAGLPFFKRAWSSILRRSPNMFTLIAIGTGPAWLFSTAAVFFPQAFPDSFRTHDGMIGVYFETAALIITLVLLGQVLELKARSRTSSALRALLGLKPKTARIVREDGTEEDIPLEQVHPGDRLRVRPGEKVPVDGLILEGSSSLDEALITGESLPAEKGPGAKVTAATINQNGSFVMRAERVGKDTLLSQIIKMVSEAQRSRAPIQKLADRVSFYFVPAVMAVSVLTFILWSRLGPEPRMAHALVNAIAVLIIACPCALGLATPMSIMVGTGQGARSGVLIRNAEALETFEKVDTLVVDKTGTLTEGKPELASIRSLGLAENELLAYAASLEQLSEHPLGGAVVRAARSRGVPFREVKDFAYQKGKGIEGSVDGKKVLLGSRKIMEDRSVGISALVKEAEALQEEGRGVIFIALEDKAAGLISVSDPIKESSLTAIRELHAEGIRVVMLTGDNLKTAQAVGKRLGIDEIHAEVLPEDKERHVRKLQDDGRMTAMAGDGVNDAPALARAHVGIAMGTGTDVAMESAGIVLLKGDLRGIAKALKLSRAVMRNIRQNLFFAFVYNALGVPVAAGLLYPFTGLLLSPVIAAAAMTFSSVSVIANALRLRNVRL